MSTIDPEFEHTPKFSPEQYQAPPRERGCFFYGCIIASVLALLVAILIGIAVFVGYRWLNQVVNDYTSTTAEQLPTVKMPAEERQSLKDRVEAFRKAVKEGTTTEPLVLSGDDLNALIDENAELKGTVYVKVEGDQVKGQVSFPLDKLQVPLPMLKGRYLNGQADFRASLFDGELIVHLEALEVNGKKVPDQIMTDIRKQNMAKDASKNPDLAETLRKIESLEIKDGKIILTARGKPGASSAEKASKKDAPVELAPPKSDQLKAVPPNNGAPTEKAKPDPAPAAAPKS
jgi:hypothetical protein